MDFATVLRMELAWLDMTAKTFAEKTGYTESKISRTLSGKRRPDIDDIATFGDVLGVDGWELMRRASGVPA